MLQSGTKTDNNVTAEVKTFGFVLAANVIIIINYGYSHVSHLLGSWQ